MKKFNKIAVIGTGLIGGSIALALKKKALSRKIVGVSRRRSSLAWAKKIGAIDTGAQTLDIVKGADLVILAVPVNAIIEKGLRIAKIIAPGCIVFDVGSTKDEIVRKLTPRISGFVGTHPLAGSEKRGVKNASAGLFRGSLCILTPVKKTKASALNCVKKIWQGLGARVRILNPRQHDKILAAVSHLPHIAAFALINSVPSEYLGFAANGLKDTTRIAGSESLLWRDILITNRNNSLRALEVFEAKLKALKKALQRKDRKLLLKILNLAKDKRERLG
jgi:prephenate dehydrogenase